MKIINKTKYKFKIDGISKPFFKKYIDNQNYFLQLSPKSINQSCKQLICFDRFEGLEILSRSVKIVPLKCHTLMACCMQTIFTTILHARKLHCCVQRDRFKLKTHKTLINFFFILKDVISI